MPAYKNKENGSWYVVTQYTDWTGSRKPKCKRGFSTKREAQEWEQKFQQQNAGDLSVKVSTGPAQRKKGAPKRPCKHLFFARPESIFNQI